MSHLTVLSRIIRQGPTYDIRSPHTSWARPPGRRPSARAATARRIPSGILRLGAAASRTTAPSRLDIASSGDQCAPMKLPHRRPRAVYEVYDAAERLGGPVVGLDGADLESDIGSDQFDDRVGESVDARREPVSAMSPTQGSFAVRRVLTGLALCSVAACVLISIGVVLLHLLAGAGAGQPRIEGRAQPRTNAAGRGRDADAAVSQASGVPISRPRLSERSPAPMGALASSDTLRRRPGGIVNSTKWRPGSRAPAPDRSWLARGFALPVAFTPAIAYPIMEGPALGCACTAAQAEFGFER